jgi:hypothetical protein
MRKFLLSSAFAAAASVAGPAAQAFPAPPLAPLTAPVIEVRDACGLGWHRAPNGACYRDGVYPYAYGPYAYGPYAYAPPPYYYAGRCWWRPTLFGPRRVCTW